MRALVHRQEALEAEALATLRAHEGPLPAVHTQVLKEPAVVCKAAATLAAGERLLPVVLPCMGS